MLNIVFTFAVIFGLQLTTVWQPLAESYFVIAPKITVRVLHVEVTPNTRIFLGEGGAAGGAEDGITLWLASAANRWLRWGKPGTSCLRPQLVSPPVYLPRLKT